MIRRLGGKEQFLKVQRTENRIRNAERGIKTEGGEQMVDDSR